MPGTAHGLYRLTFSTIEGQPVGSLIIDKGTDSHRSWHLYSPTTGFTPGFAGIRVGLVCGDCRALGHAAQHGHDGDHGPTAPPVHIEPTDAPEVTP